MAGLIAATSFEIALDALGELPMLDRRAFPPGTRRATVQLTALAGGWNSGAIEVKRIIGDPTSAPARSFGISRTASADGLIDLDFDLLADGPTSGLAFEVTTAAAGRRVRVDITESG